MPRLATSGTSRFAGRLGPLGAPATMGAAATAATVVGAAGSPDVESHRQCLGILQQRRVDVDLTSASTAQRCVGVVVGVDA